MFLSLKMFFVLANSVDPDEMLHHAGVHIEELLDYKGIRFASFQTRGPEGPEALT